MGEQAQGGSLEATAAVPEEEGEPMQTECQAGLGEDAVVGVVSMEEEAVGMAEAGAAAVLQAEVDQLPMAMETQEGQEEQAEVLPPSP